MPQALLPLLSATVVLTACFSVLHSSEPDDGRPAARSSSDEPALPDQFHPVDTSRFMLRPDPAPLEAFRAFPALTFKRPVELTAAPDDSNRLFVVEQQGRILVFDNRDDVSEARVFLDIQDAVLRKGNEEGLLGLAFHPKFRENGEFFVYYSTPPRVSVVSRFRVAKADPNQADRDSEEQLLRIDQPYSNHNGGSIRFGPDGFLYIGLGDGGLANDPHVNAQNLETLLGSILRIDVNRRDEGLKYAIPEDNPFAGRDDARGEIWALGLRNPWRLSFDRKTGELWTGDVGQNRFEEVNLIQKGGNYGWNIREGFHPFEPQSPAKTSELTDPMAEYFRSEGQSVTGGVVYRGPSLKDFQGSYFYGDYLSGNVWSLRHKNRETVQNRLVARTGLQIAAFGEDQQGEMYLCAFDGQIYRLRPRDAETLSRAEQFPRRLSETGLFQSVKENQPAEGLIPYELNMPFWSDYAVKDRYIALPKNQSVTFDKQKKWQFPVGSVFVKTFWMHRDRSKLADPFRLETRLLIHAPDGWFGVTYVYNDDQTDAELLEGSRLRPLEITTDEGTISQPYYFPSRSDCMACHTKAEGFVLGPTTRQMNHTLNYHGASENQLDLLDRLKVFTRPLDAAPDQLEQYPTWQFGNLDRSPHDDQQESTLTLPDAPAEELARAWLDVNCATCHRPESAAPGKVDMRYHTPLSKMGLVNQPPGQGNISPPGSRLISPGQPLHSERFFRATHRGGTRQMPPLASNVVDPRGAEVLRKWIEGLQQPE